MARRIVAIEQVRRGPLRLPSETELAAMLMLFTVDQVIRYYDTDVFSKFHVKTRINSLMKRDLFNVSSVSNPDQ